MPTRVQETVTPSWKAALDQIESRYQRSHLRRLAIFCGSRQIAPDEVDDAVSGAYRGHLEASLVDRPKQVHRDAVLAWNIAVETVQGWPQIVLTPPENRGETSLPLSAFAPSFRLDVEAYLHHLSGKDLLTAAAKKVTRASPVTLRNRTVEIRRAATELVRAGHDPLTITKLADLVAKPAAECLLNRMWECNGSQPSGQAYNVARTLLAIARHWVKADTADVENLSILCRALKPPRTGHDRQEQRAAAALLQPTQCAPACHPPRSSPRGSPAAAENCERRSRGAGRRRRGDPAQRAHARKEPGGTPSHEKPDPARRPMAMA